AGRGWRGRRGSPSRPTGTRRSGRCRRPVGRSARRRAPGRRRGGPPDRRSSGRSGPGESRWAAPGWPCLPIVAAARIAATSPFEPSRLARTWRAADGGALRVTEERMNLTQTQEIVLLGVAIVVLIVAGLLVQRRRAMDQDARTRESPYAAWTEGEKRCPNCGMFNLWTDRTCISCKRPLPG